LKKYSEGPQNKLWKHDSHYIDAPNIWNYAKRPKSIAGEKARKEKDSIAQENGLN